MKPTQFINQKLIHFALSSCFLFGACSAEANNRSGNPDPRPEVKVGPVKKRTIKLALILDTSNSMDGLIDQAKAQLWNIVNQLAAASCNGEKPALQIALYQYGNDGLPAAEGYIQLVTPLTTDLDQLSEDLFRLRTNGGSEFCGQAIQTALRQLDWNANPDDYKVIFIAGNEPFTQGSVSYAEVCKQASSRNIIVNTIHCGSFDQGISESWQKGAQLGRGKYMSIDQNVKTEYIASPYDQKISELNYKLNDTYIPYGKEGEEKKQKMIEQDRNAAYYGTVNEVKRANVKASGAAYQWGKSDLTESSENGDVDYKALKPESLPAVMKNMSAVEKETYVKKKAEERKQIQTEIQQLNKQREEHVKQQKSAKKDASLDDAILNAITEQAKEQQFSFPK